VLDVGRKRSFRVATPPLPSVEISCLDANLHRLATDAGEKSGLGLK